MHGSCREGDRPKRSGRNSNQGLWHGLSTRRVSSVSLVALSKGSALGQKHRALPAGIKGKLHLL